MSEEPQFYRLSFPNYPRSPWVADYSIKDAGIQASLTATKAKAQIYITPAPTDLERLRATFGPVTLEPATFAEWIEQGAAAHIPKNHDR